MDDVNLVLDSLSKLITTTKLKVNFFFSFLHLFVSCVCYVLTININIFYTIVADCLQFRGVVLICTTVRCIVPCYSL